MMLMTDRQCAEKREKRKEKNKETAERIFKNYRSQQLNIPPMNRQTENKKDTVQNVFKGCGFFSDRLHNRSYLKA
jgi:hypothetical protein